MLTCVTCCHVTPFQLFAVEIKLSTIISAYAKQLVSAMSCQPLLSPFCLGRWEAASNTKHQFEAVYGCNEDITTDKPAICCSLFESKVRAIFLHLHPPFSSPCSCFVHTNSMAVASMLPT